jgi:small subunit ribosomal protein S1
MNLKSTRSQEEYSDIYAAFEQALDQQNYQFIKGQVIKGKTYQHSTEGAYIDIGGKSAAFLPFKEAFCQNITSLAEVVPLNQEREFLIIREANEEGQVTLSLRQLEIKKTWDELAEMADQGLSVQIRITQINKGGAIGEVKGLQGFIPKSHLQEKVNLDSLLNQLITATFLEVNPEQRRLVLSQREAMKAAAIQTLKPGNLVEGTVVSLKPYGAFIDISGITGLLHTSQISGNPIASLNAVLQVGQTLKVVVLEIDEYKNRFSLSTKVLENHPGEILTNFAEVMATAEERVVSKQNQ